MTKVLSVMQAFWFSSPFPLSHVPKFLSYDRKQVAGQFGEVVLKPLQRSGRLGFPGKLRQITGGVCVQETSQRPKKHPALRGFLN